jgi:hypothetical protein
MRGFLRQRRKNPLGKNIKILLELGQFLPVSVLLVWVLPAWVVQVWGLLLWVQPVWVQPVWVQLVWMLQVWVLPEKHSVVRGYLEYYYLLVYYLW